MRIINTLIQKIPDEHICSSKYFQILLQSTDFGNLMYIYLRNFIECNKGKYVIKDYFFNQHNTNICVLNLSEKIYDTKQPFIDSVKCIFCNNEDNFCTECGGFVENEFFDGYKFDDEIICDPNYIFTSKDTRIRGKLRTMQKPSAYLLPISENSYMCIDDSLLEFIDTNKVFFTYTQCMKLIHFIFER